MIQALKTLLPGRRRCWILLFISVRIFSVSAPAQADRSRPVEFWTIEPNEGQSAGGHSAIRIGDWIYHVEHRGDGLVVDRRDRRSDFERVYRRKGNRSIDVLRLGLPSSVEAELESTLRLRHFERRQRTEQLAAVEEELRWLDRSLDLGRLEVEVPGLGLLSVGPSDCLGPEAGFLVARRDEIVRRYGFGWLEGRIAASRQALHHALRRVTGSDPAEIPAAAHDSAPSMGSLRGVVDAAQLVAALEAIHACRAPAPDRLVSLIPEKAALFDPALGMSSGSASRESWLAIGAQLESNFLRLLNSRRRDSGLAIILAWGRLAAIDRTRSNLQTTLFDSFAEAVEDVEVQRRLATRVPHEWWALRRESARRLLVQRVDELISGTGEFLESKLFRVEAARHALAHAEAFQLHAAPHSEPPLRVTRAIRHGAGMIDLPWPDALTIRDLRAHRDRVASQARQLRLQLRDEFGYALLTRNCVTELFTVLDAALASDPKTAAFGHERRRDWESMLSFIPVAARRIARRNLPVTETHRLPSWREAALDARRTTGVWKWIEAVRESNTVSSETYRSHPGDSIFLVFSNRSIWLRPLAGIANLATGVGATLIGALRAPFDRGRTLRRGLSGIAMSVPELFFFNIRKGSYVVAPPLGLWKEAVDERIERLE